ncbi:hypothetical protein [Arthrobacter sp. UYCu723]
MIDKGKMLLGSSHPGRKIFSEPSVVGVRNVDLFPQHNGPRHFVVEIAGMWQPDEIIVGKDKQLPLAGFGETVKIPLDADQVSILLTYQCQDSAL